MSAAPESYILTLIGLQEGFGVEDIARQHGLDCGLVRRHVQAMRANGVLATIYRGL